MDMIALVVAGIIAGLLAGLFGIGGGALIVPALIFVFSTHHWPASYIAHMAIATSLAIMVVSSLSSVTAHYRAGNIQWPVVRHMVPGILIGALSGDSIAHHLSSQTLHSLFALFILLSATQMLLDYQPKEGGNLPSIGGLISVATVIGCLSAMVGIGGGTLLIPFFTYCGLYMRQAAANAASCSLAIALSGSLGYMFLGAQHKLSLPYTSGYIYWPAFASMAISGAIFAPIGARLATRLPSKLLKKIFAGFLLAIALMMFTFK